MGIEHTIMHSFNGYKTVSFDREAFNALLVDLKNLTYPGICQTIARFVDEHADKNKRSD